MRLWNGCIVSLTTLCLCCLLSSCDIQGNTLTSNTDVTVNTTATGSTTTARAVSTSGAGGANALYLYDTFIDSYPFRTMRNMAQAMNGVIVAAPSDAYVQYTLPLQPSLFVQVEVANFQPTNGYKYVLLHLTDSQDAWVGDNHVWVDSSLIEIRQVDTQLRFRVGGNGEAEFKAEYVYDGLQYGAAYTIGLDVSPTNAILYVNGVSVANFPAITFKPRTALYLFVGGGVGNESCLNLLVQSVAIFF